MKRQYTYFYMFSVLIVSIITLMVGCQSHVFSPAQDNTPKLPRHVKGASDARMIALQTRLNQRGAKVITIGQEYLVSIPSSILFADESPRLRWKSYDILNQCVSFLKQFRKVSVYVTAYSEPYGTRQRQFALTEARARAVGDYLWSQGINSRFIFTLGAGSTRPIVSCGPHDDTSPNSRVELVFKDVIV